MKEQTLFTPADILIPKSEYLDSWCAIACDQYTSDKEYWEKCFERVGDKASALKLIFPEAFLSDNDAKSRIENIHANMEKYLSDGVFNEYKNSFIYVERDTPSGMRDGIIGKLDLENYSYAAGAKSDIRPTEGTVESRIPPRVEIRKDAVLEMPHIMVLIDDAKKTVVETAAKDAGELLYNVDLGAGGRVRGKLLNGEAVEKVSAALAELFAHGGIKIAVGDGNHSLATAKACFEALKSKLPEHEWRVHPARWALVELVNIHCDALIFEPIHRVAIGVDCEKLIRDVKTYFSGATDGKKFRIICGENEEQFFVISNGNNIEIGVFQDFLDAWIAKNGGEIDYIHGEKELRRLAGLKDCVGFEVVGVEKNELFSAVELTGALPRKTFSMGEADEKRYYLETRLITTV